MKNKRSANGGLQTGLFVVLSVLAFVCTVAPHLNPVLAGTWYVSVDGDDTLGGTTWGTAWLTISNAVRNAVNGDMVIVSNGTYDISAQINITKSLAMASLFGRAGTVIDGGGSAYCVYLNNAAAVLDGFTITNANRGVTLSGGTVQNCDITCCLTNGGVHMTSGTLTNCTVSHNIATTNYGGGVSLWNGGVVQNCIIISNICYRGGGVHCYGAGTVRNCLVAWNYSSNRGGGIHAGYGSTAFENCTVVKNAAGGQAGGVHYFQSMVNMLIYSNSAPADANWYAAVGARSSSNCCSTPSLNGFGTDNITVEPRLKNWVESDFRLSKSSPCIDGGLNLGWMTSYADLDGLSRIFPRGGTVDIGAYEYRPSGMVFMSR